MNSIPRFTGGKDFEPSDSNYWLGVGLIALPWAIVALIYAIKLAVIYLCPCCSFCRAKSKEDGGGSMCCKVMLILFAVLALAGCGIAFYGNVLAIDGLKDADDSFDDIHTSWQSARSLVEQSLQLSGDAMSNTLAYEDVCGGENSITAQIKAGLEVFDESIAEFDVFADEVDQVFEDTRDGIDLAGTVITIGGFVILGIGALIVVVAFVGVFVSGKGSCASCSLTLRMIMLPVSIVIIVFLWIMVGVMAANVGVADYCMDPDDNLAKLSDDDDIQTILRFYTECEGENPLYTEYTRARFALLAVDSLVDALRVLQQATCPAGEESVDALQGNVDDALDVLDDIRELIECQTINEPYQTFSYDAICDDWHMALLFTWIGSCVCAFFFSFMILFYDRANGRQRNCCCGGGDPED